MSNTAAAVLVGVGGGIAIAAVTYACAALAGIWTFRRKQRNKR
jgi:hypothetical protein